ncbi:MAG: hypothetical protein R2851_13375 [Caldilineaceae bacterium]
MKSGFFAAFFRVRRGRSLCRRVRRSGNALLRSGGRAQCTAGRAAHPPPDGGPNERFAFYGDDLIDVFYQLFYWSGSPAILPKVLVDAETGRFGYIEAIPASIIFDDTFSDGMYNSVICTEDADFVPDDANLDGVRPSFSAGFVEELDEYIAACDLWQVPPFGAEIDAPVASDIPTLLCRARSIPSHRRPLPRKPPHPCPTAATWSWPRAATASRSAPMHALTTSWTRLSPAVAPDDACLETVAPPAFVAPNVVVVPLLSYLNALNRGVDPAGLVGAAAGGGAVGVCGVASRLACAQSSRSAGGVGDLDAGHGCWSWSSARSPPRRDAADARHHLWHI